MYTHELIGLEVQVAISVLELMAQWRLKPTPLSAVDENEQRAP